MSDLIKRLRSTNDEWQLEAADRIEQLEAALGEIETRGLEIISEHVGGSDASYVAQELTALAHKARRRQQ